MATTQTNGFDRFNEALRSLDDQLQELRERFDGGRKRIQKELRKRSDRIQDDIRGSIVYRRAEQARRDVGDVVERAREQVFDVVGLATKSDIDKLNRKLNTITKKVNELAKEHEGI